MSQEEKETVITLEDIDNAITIIEIFIKRYEKAQRLLRRLSSYTSSRKRIEDMIFEMAIAQTLGKTPSEVEESAEIDIPPEELEEIKKRARELAKKLKR